MLCQFDRWLILVFISLTLLVIWIIRLDLCKWQGGLALKVPLVTLNCCPYYPCLTLVLNQQSCVIRGHVKQRAVYLTGSDSGRYHSVCRHKFTNMFSPPAVYLFCCAVLSEHFLCVSGTCVLAHGSPAAPPAYFFFCPENWLTLHCSFLTRLWRIEARKVCFLI